jgi:hypothetical protein
VHAILLMPGSSSNAGSNVRAKRNARKSGPSRATL